MKIVCEICKTEYNIAPQISGNVRCAICGHTWTHRATNRRNIVLLFIASLCALLSAMIFTMVILAHHRASDLRANPLIATVSGIEMTSIGNDSSSFIVSGNVINRTDKIYGMPDLWLVGLDSHDNIIWQQRFMPNATLIDAGSTIPFKHTVSFNSRDIKKIMARLTDTKGDNK